MSSPSPYVGSGSSFQRLLQVVPYRDEPLAEYEEWFSRGIIQADRSNFWLIVSDAVARTVLSSASVGAVHPWRRSRIAFGPTLVDTDGDQHRKYAQVVRGVFSTAGSTSLGETVSLCAASLLGKHVRADLAMLLDAASRLPLLVMMNCLGIPSDALSDLWPFVTALSEYINVGHSGSITVLDARERISAYVQEFVLDAARVSPHGLHVLSDVLMSAELTSAEVTRLAVSLLVIGTATTRIAIRNVVAWLATCSNDDYELAVEYGIASRPVLTEILRLLPPARALPRYVSGSLEIGDFRIPDGAELLIMIPAANRDPAVHERAAFFDPNRSGVRRALTFGAGAHACIGAGLAYDELRAVISTVGDAIDRVRESGAARVAQDGLAFAPYTLEMADGTVLQ